MAAYTIQLEGRSKEDVLQVGKTVRIDTYWNLEGIVELSDFNYEVQSKHNVKTLDGDMYTTYYILLVSKKELNKYKGKRFVTNNSYNLGIDNEMFDDERNAYIPFWYIFDKATGNTIEGYEEAGEGARSRLKKECDKLNKILG